MAYLWAGATSYVAFVHYDVTPIPYLHHYLLFIKSMAYLWAGATSRVAFVHYDVPLSHIYTIIFYFYKSGLIGFFCHFGVCCKILILWVFQACFLRFFPRFSLTI